MDEQNRKTFLLATESENALLKAFLKRGDIRPILIGFSSGFPLSELHTVQAAGVPVFVVDKNAKYREECQRLSSFLRELRYSVDVFFNDSEFNQVYIQRMARCLGFPGALTEEQASLVRDKLKMKQFVRSLGLDCPDFYPLASLRDAEKCAELWGYPFIIKWRNGVSSIDVYKISSPQQLQELHLDFPSNRYMAERFQAEKIWCVDAVVRDGIVLKNLFTWLPYTNLNFAENKRMFAQVATAKSGEGWQFDPAELTQTVISGLGLPSGYLHMEVFVTANGLPSICEFGWRTPGEHMLENFSQLYGVDMADCLIDVLMGGTLFSLEPLAGCVADVFLPMREGRISRISSVEELRHSCLVLDGHVDYRVGDVLKSKRKYTDSAGWVQVAGRDLEELSSRIRQVYDTFILEIGEVEA